jgi:hypothetical protein
MLHTKDQAYRDDCLQNQYTVVKDKSCKHNKDLHNVGMYGPSENLISYLKIRKLKPKLLFDSCEFEQVYFSQVDLSKIGFINCSFVNCVFDECLTSTTYPLSKIKLHFMSCNFHMCRFTDCKFFDGVVYACCFFHYVLFINDILIDTTFSQCCYVDFKFIDNCKLINTRISSPSGCFDVQFENINGSTKIDQLTEIDDFTYKETGFNEKLDKLALNPDRAYRTKNGFMNFLTQITKNNLPQHYSDIFYKSKKAETRTIKNRYARYFWMFVEIFCGYCEKPFRIIIGIVITIFIWSFFYLSAGFSINNKNIQYVFDLSRATLDWKLINDYISSLKFSFYTLITVGLGGEFTPVSAVWSEFWFYLELALGVVLLQLLTTTIVRRLTR